MPRSFPTAYVVAVNMGYGHERAAYGIKHLAKGGIIHANAYDGIPERDTRLWEKSRHIYEQVSRFQQLPFIGPLVFQFLDRFQRIAPFYPRRDLSAPSLQLKQTYYSIETLGLGKHLIQTLAKKPFPLVCTFFLPAFAAEIYNYPEDIYCVICDADISRAWVARDPKKSRIRYFAPNGRVAERLQLYGVRKENIFFTGFPLPKELMGQHDATIIRDLKTRLHNLDPKRIFITHYLKTLEMRLGNTIESSQTTHPLTLTFAVGGAGAQHELALDIMKSLKEAIQAQNITLRIVAGINQSIAQQFQKYAHRLGLSRNPFLKIEYWPHREEYFKEFTQLLRTTDILWTKPSELSFYTGLGIPIIMAPPIGSQEQFNRTWLESVGGGIAQGDPRYVHEWLFDWINSGGLARMAWNGYLEAPTHGAYRIEDTLLHRDTTQEKLPLIV